MILHNLAGSSVKLCCPSLESNNYTARSILEILFTVMEAFGSRAGWSN